MPLSPMFWLTLLPVAVASIAAVVTLRNHVRALEGKVDAATETLKGELSGMRGDLHELTGELKDVRINEARDLERFRQIDQKCNDHENRIRALEGGGR